MTRVAIIAMLALASCPDDRRTAAFDDEAAQFGTTDDDEEEAVPSRQVAPAESEMKSESGSIVVHVAGCAVNAKGEITFRETASHAWMCAKAPTAKGSTR